MAKHCLIVSPIPSHPPFQGNSARIFRFGRCLQALGYRVHFFYYPLEGLSDRQRRQMSEAWDHFYSIPCDLPNTKRSLGDHYAIDDWYDPRAGELVAELHRRWRYQAVVVNYVWFSAVLEALPNDVLKLIDTHDVFGDRHLRAIEAGMRPEWFYTSIAEEARGLRRADIVVAIQDQEQRYFESLGLARVETIGFIAPERTVPARRREKPAVGYIGSGNPWNVHAFRSLVRALGARPELAERAEFVAAGPICDQVKDDPGPFRLLGILDKVEEFYAAVDIALNPMIGGTGLKIKTLEALAFGKGVLSTRDGFVGIPTTEPAHTLDSVDALCAQLAHVLEFPNRMAALQVATREVFRRYQRRAVEAFVNIFGTTPVSGS
ncbi:glycosyltransferase [Candidatus Methylocalor cossyra]|uniref:Glycosyl transferase 4-like domain-containing protein n=1 Tax=Candidatus Methylocalor cossyra TaxID=3108543 RepID=A0ABM9NIT7_9GAMM